MPVLDHMGSDQTQQRDRVGPSQNRTYHYIPSSHVPSNTHPHANLMRHYGALWETPASASNDDDDEQNDPRHPSARSYDNAPPTRTTYFESDSEDGESSPNTATAADGSGIPPPESLYQRLGHQHTRLFRILRLYPRLEIQIRAFSLSDMPNYVALSHRWGQEAPSTDIRCNDDFLIMLKPSLVSAIRNVSQFIAEGTWLWVDGICIKQNDEDEKAQQVRLLWKIFADARAVLIYLGDGDSETAAAIGAMRNAASTRDRHVNEWTWPGIKALLHREWFERLWTMQEAIVAQTLEVICGEEMVSWKDLEYVYRFVTPEGPFSRGHQLDPRDIAISISSIESIIYLRRWRAEHGESELRYVKEILWLMARQDCFLAVDRVYAVLGLFAPDVMAQIDVDYSADSRKSYWVTYREFCRVLVKSMGRDQAAVLQTLTEISGETHRCPGYGPAWCPDFSRPQGREVDRRRSWRHLEKEEMEEEIKLRDLSIKTDV